MTAPNTPAPRPSAEEVVAELKAAGVYITSDGRRIPDMPDVAVDHAIALITSLAEENERLNDGLDKVAEEREAWKRSHAEWKALAIKNEDHATALTRAVEERDEALRKIARMKPEPIGDTGFQVGPLSLFLAAQQIAKAALRAGRRAASLSDMGGA